MNFHENARFFRPSGAKLEQIFWLFDEQRGIDPVPGQAVARARFLSSADTTTRSPSRESSDANKPWQLLGVRNGPDHKK
ncbi:hypothetical protein [Desulfovibrio sp. TomC]|uniref:hypothetical protein n=1 Tax=Desulfovibrio sp. TomC TaxID=1562888 RepID=UPI0012E12B4B|nr:hypothetical protein [Desulfovibrio sp. TomC]